MSQKPLALALLAALPGCAGLSPSLEDWAFDVAVAQVVGPRGEKASPRPPLRATVTELCDATACAAVDTTHLEGVLLWVGTDTLALYDRNRRADVLIPRAGLARLEIFRERAPGDAEDVATGIVVGAAIGGVGSATAYAILAAGWGRSNRNLGKAAATGALFGAVAGGLIAARNGPKVWQEITIGRLRQELCGCQDPDGTLSPNR